MVNLPDPTVIAKAGAEAARGVVSGGLDIMKEVVSGVESGLFDLVNSSIQDANSLGQTITGLAGAVARQAQQAVRKGEITVDQARRQVDSAANNVLSQVDRGIGGEIVRKFKSEFERLLR